MNSRALIYILALFSLALWFPSQYISETFCESNISKDYYFKKEAEMAKNCFDFWLNRYQILISSVLFVACIAILVVKLQKYILTNQSLIAAVLGKANPDFFLEWVACPDYNSGELQDGVLIIQNHSPHPICLRKIELIYPNVNYLIRECCSDTEMKANTWIKQLDNKVFALNKVILGLNRNDRTSITKIRLIIRDEADLARSGMDEEFRLKIDFHVLGSLNQEQQINVYGLIRRC